MHLFRAGKFGESCIFGYGFGKFWSLMAMVTNNIQKEAQKKKKKKKKKNMRPSDE